MLRTDSLNWGRIVQQPTLLLELELLLPELLLLELELELLELDEELELLPSQHRHPIVR